MSSHAERYPLGSEARKFAKRWQDCGEVPSGEFEEDEQVQARRELYVITSVVADSVVPEMINAVMNNPHSEAKVYTFADLEKYMDRVSGAYFDSEWPRWSTQSDFVPLIARIRVLAEIVENIADKSLSFADRKEQALLRGGLKTGTSASTALLKMLPEVVYRDLEGATHETVAVAARNSGHLPAQLGSLELRQFNATMHDLIAPISLWEVAIRTDAFRAILHHGKPVVIFDEPTGQSDGTQRYESLYNGPDRERLGCLAGVAFTSSSAIEKVWNWAIDLAIRGELWKRQERALSL